MGSKGLRYRLGVYLIVTLCMILPMIAVAAYDYLPLVIGMYLPVVILTELGTVRIISRHGGVETARRSGFRERLVMNVVLVLCWILVAFLVGWHGFIIVIICGLLPLLIFFDLVLIYRILPGTYRTPIQ